MRGSQEICFVLMSYLKFPMHVSWEELMRYCLPGTAQIPIPVIRRAGVRHFSHVPDQQGHPLVVLELGHGLVVGHVQERLPVDFQYLIAHLKAHRSIITNRNRRRIRIILQDTALDRQGVVLGTRGNTILRIDRAFERIAAEKDVKVAFVRA